MLVGNHHGQIVFSMHIILIMFHIKYTSSFQQTRISTLSTQARASYHESPLLQQHTMREIRTSTGNIVNQGAQSSSDTESDGEDNEGLDDEEDNEGLDDEEDNEGLDDEEDNEGLDDEDGDEDTDVEEDEQEDEL